jgi:hypothetical protein
MVKSHKSIAILRGIIGVLLLNFLFLIICLACAPLSILFTYLWSAIGFSQFIYITPVLIFLRYEERWGIFQGAMIGAGLTILVNAGYYLSFLWQR